MYRICCFARAGRGFARRYARGGSLEVIGYAGALCESGVGRAGRDCPFQRWKEGEIDGFWRMEPITHDFRGHNDGGGVGVELESIVGIISILITVIIGILNITPARNKILETIKFVWIKITNVPAWFKRQLGKRRVRAEYVDLFCDTDRCLLQAARCLEVAHKLFEKFCVTEEDKALLEEFSDMTDSLLGQRDMLKWKRQALMLGDWEGFNGKKRL